MPLGQVLGERYHFFASFDKQCRLLEVYAYQKQGGHLSDFEIRTIQDSDRARVPGIAYQIHGPIAELLYIAITGRPRGVDPETASAEVAILARGFLAMIPSWASSICCVALAQFGPYYQPWFGTIKLTETGAIILDDPDYTRLEPLYGQVVDIVVPQWKVVEQIIPLSSGMEDIIVPQWEVVGTD